jgi:PAS domain S-box-containing protein
MSETSPSPDLTRWRGLFATSPEPLFLLNQQRRVLSVNPAWETLLGLRAAQVRGLSCRSRRMVAEVPEWHLLAHVLCPPATVLDGNPALVRREVQRADRPREWWDIAFFPLNDARGRVRILGRIRPASVEEPAARVPLPETLASVRERVDARYTLENLTSTAPAMRLVANQVRLACQSATPVLLVGETGSGKEWLARIIHHEGPHREQSFAALDCPSLPPTVLSSILFDSGGLLTSGAVGTVFLRAISESPRDVQDRLSDWLGDTGATRPRLLASSRIDPGEAVRAGRLVESLHCTLSTLVIAVPPLRERRADLRDLIARLATRLMVEDGQKMVDFSPAAWEVLHAYSWPGNVRELLAVLMPLRGKRIEVGDLPLSLRLATGLTRETAPPPRALRLDSLLEQVERRLMALALRQARGNKSKAAELLGIWRARLIRRMEALGLDQE